MAKMLHMCVGVTDMARSERFYKDVLDLDVRDRYANEAGWTISYLSNGESAMELELVVWKTPGLTYAPPGQDIHVAVAVDDLEAEHARVSKIARTEAITPVVFDGREVARYFFAADPDGNWIEFMSGDGRFG